MDETSATIWLETNQPAQVTIVAGAHTTATHTFTVHNHHYALVILENLPPGIELPYHVHLDEQPYWPAPDAQLPSPTIKTGRPSQPTRIMYASCRTAMPDDDPRFGIDALRRYAHHLSTAPPKQWPDLLLLIGDQIYADEPPTPVREFIAARRNLEEPPGAELADYDEYAAAYRHAWSEPAIAWLLSCIPTAMIFDDHDVRDDWNTSQTWREEMSAQPWWSDRITAGLASYWVYQHLGNLSPIELATDPLWRLIAAAAGGDCGAEVDRFMRGVDADPTTYQFSHSRDIGGVRLIALDVRCGRILTPDDRAILDAPEWAWFSDQVQGDRDHVLIASSLPVILPRAIHHVERWNERAAQGAWGRKAAAFAEWLRRYLDLEHWPAFGKSFYELTRIVDEVCSGKRGRSPVTVQFLSGDVHYSYVAQVKRPVGHTAVAQLVCSPIQHPLNRKLRWANMVASWPVVTPFVWLAAWMARAGTVPWRWRLTRRPRFDNTVAVVELDAAGSTARWITPQPKGAIAEFMRFDLR